MLHSNLDAEIKKGKHLPKYKKMLKKWSENLVPVSNLSWTLLC